jgi:hypothetical protein
VNFGKKEMETGSRTPPEISGLLWRSWPGNACYGTSDPMAAV